MSPASPLTYLFSPLRIGPVEVRNRIVFAAHLTNYAEDGLPTAQHAAYYAARPPAAPGSSSPRSSRPTLRTGRTRS